MGAEQDTFYDAILLKGMEKQEEIIRFLAKHLQDKGYVNEQYGKATLEREKLYPTGLGTKPIGIAVPHSNPENVIRQAVVVGISNTLVEFKEMGTADQSVNVGIVIMLALKGENMHINYLKNIVNYFRYESNMNYFYGLQSETKIRQVFMTDVLQLAD